MEVKKANEYQVGGDHYAKAEVQHWDVVSRNNVGYLEGAATKYLSRWRDKNGLEDLHKAKHFTVKLAELYVDKQRALGGKVKTEEVLQFVTSYKLNKMESAACMYLLQWSTVTDLYDAMAAIDSVISEAVKEGYRLKTKPAFHTIDNTGQARPFGYDPDDIEGR